MTSHEVDMSLPSRQAFRYTAVVLLFSSAALTAQVPRDAKPVGGAPAAGKGSISGVVVSADVGRPVRRAAVTLSGGEPTISRSAQTDDQGAFAFTDLPAGEFTLTTNKGGFVQSIYGQKEPGSGRPGTPIRLLAGQQLNQVSLPLARGAVLTGTVLDEVGDPAFGIVVRSYRWVMKSGERTLQPGASATTDDRGIYRIPALQPGEYVAGVMPNLADSVALKLNGAVEYVKVLEAVESSYSITVDSPMVFRTRLGADNARTVPKTGFGAAFYPGVAQVSAAQSITLGPGEERPGIDFNLQVVPLAQISGVVSSSTGPVSGATIQLVDASQPVGFGGKSARSGPDGRFAFEGVTPGQYTLSTRAAPKGAPQLEAGAREAVEFLVKAEAGQVPAISKAINAAAQMWAATDIVVDGRDHTDVQLLLQAGATVSGRVTVDAGTEPVLTRMTIGLSPVGLLKGELSMMGPAVVDATGRFNIRGVVPGRYRLTVMGGMPGGYSLSSALFGGQDILDIPMEVSGGAAGANDGVVTLTTKTTDVSGVIQDASGMPAVGVTVIVYPAEERFWTPEARRIQAVRPATDGRYQIRNLPPGDYRLVAVSDVEPGRWYDPALLRTLAGFTMFTLQPGGKHVQDFRLK